MANLTDYALILAVPMAIGVGYYLFHGRKRDERQALLEYRCIYPELKLVMPYQDLARTKNALGPYAEGLGWAISEGNAGAGNMATLIVAPPRTAISPRDYAAGQRRIFDASYAIFRDLVFGGDDEKAKKRILTSKTIDIVGAKGGQKPKTADFVFRQKFGLLLISYPLFIRVRLERQDPALASAMFGGPLMEDLRALFGRENVERMKHNVRVDTGKLISEIRDMESVMKDKAEIENAEKKILETGMEGEKLEQQVEQQTANLKKRIEEAFDLEIAA